MVICEKCGREIIGQPKFINGSTLCEFCYGDAIFKQKLSYELKNEKRKSKRT